MPLVRTICPLCEKATDVDPASLMATCRECGGELVQRSPGFWDEADPICDPNEAATRVVGKATGDDQLLLPDLEAAWAEWSKSINDVDERGMTLLRAAFEAGAEAASRHND